MAKSVKLQCFIIATATFKCIPTAAGSWASLEEVRRQPHAFHSLVFFSQKPTGVLCRRPVPVRLPRCLLEVLCWAQTCKAARLGGAKCAACVSQ
eukprot:g16887.t1